MHVVESYQLFCNNRVTLNAIVIAPYKNLLFFYVLHTYMISKKKRNNTFLLKASLNSLFKILWPSKQSINLRGQKTTPQKHDFHSVCESCLPFGNDTRGFQTVGKSKSQIWKKTKRGALESIIVLSKDTIERRSRNFWDFTQISQQGSTLT